MTGALHHPLLAEEFDEGRGRGDGQGALGAEAGVGGGLAADGGFAGEGRVGEGLAGLGDLLHGAGEGQVEDGAGQR